MVGSMKTTTKKISAYFHLVTNANGIEIGFLRKAPGSRTCTTPWQPFTRNNEMLRDSKSPSGFMACYGKTGKADAINALIEVIA